VVRERPGAESACQGPELADFRILLQASLFRLWDNCTLGDGETLRNSVHPHCLAAQEGKPPLLVPGVEGAAAVAWRQQPGEEETAHVVRLLAALGFRWKDLGLDRDEGDEALTRIRQRIGEVSEALTSRQPGQDWLMMSTLTSLAANSIAYDAPRWLAWLTLGRALEVGASYDLPTRRLASLRLHAAVEVLGVFSAISSDQSAVAPALLLGLEARPRSLATATWQPSAVFRAGMVLTSADQFGAVPCQETGKDAAACTRPVLQAGLALSLVDWARLQVIGEWFPRWDGQAALWAIAPSLGIQVRF
jgi:hypothetical protein